MSTGAKSYAQISRQSPDISAFGTRQPKHQLGIWLLLRSWRETQNLLLVERNPPRLKLDFVMAALAGVLICPVTVNSDGGECRGDLINLAEKLLSQRFLNKLTRDVSCRVSCIDLRLQVETWRRLTNTDCGYVLLIMIHEGLYALSGLASADDDETCSQRVKRPSMAHLDFLYADMAFKKEANLVDGIKRRPSQRFVYQETLTGNKIQNELFLCG